MKQGDVGARVGRDRRDRRLRRAVRAQRRRHTGRRRLVARARRRCSTSSASRRSSTARPRTTGSGRTAHPGRVGVAALRQAGPRAHGGEDPDIVFEHPGRQTMGASIFAVQAGRHGRHVRGDVRLHGRVRQPPLLDEAEAADLQPLRQLRRGVGGQPADRPGPHPAGAVGRAPARRGRRGRPRGPPQRARGQDRRALPGPARGARHRRPREAATGSARTGSRRSVRRRRGRFTVGRTQRLRRRRPIEGDDQDDGEGQQRAARTKPTRSRTGSRSTITGSAPRRRRAPPTRRVAD